MLEMEHESGSEGWAPVGLNEIKMQTWLASLPVGSLWMPALNLGKVKKTAKQRRTSHDLALWFPVRMAGWQGLRDNIMVLIRAQPSPGAVSALSKCSPLSAVSNAPEVGMEGRARGPAALSRRGLVGQGPLRQSVPLTSFPPAVAGPVLGRAGKTEP